MIKYPMVKVAAVIGVLVLLASSCEASKLQDYYSKKENYVDAIGTVTKFSYNEDGDIIFLAFSGLNPTFDDSGFKIVGENVNIVQKNGIDEEIKIGDQVEFVTAPRYFGDGYAMPIVAISVNGESLLEFEDGYSNLLDWLENN